MSRIRIIPCIDMIDGKVVKGKQFKDVKQVGDVESLAELYWETGADEIVFYDISASQEGRSTNLKVLSKIGPKITVPFCIGGGISSLDHIKRCLEVGASKVSVNSFAVRNPEFVQEASDMFGSPRIVVGIDAKRKREGLWNVLLQGGTLDTGIDVIEDVKKVASLGAGELIVNSIDGDGMRKGYDISLFREVKKATNLPVIASGGAGALEDFYQVTVSACVDGVLAASLFHLGEIKILDLKRYLMEKGVDVSVD